MTLNETPSIVAPSGIAGVAFHDEPHAANALVDRREPPFPSQTGIASFEEALARRADSSPAIAAPAF